MSYCTQCGHRLGVGRFCTSCGTPVRPDAADPELRTDTAERPAVPSDPEATALLPRTPPAAEPEQDYSGRYRLFADEVGDADPPGAVPPPYAEEYADRRPAPWGLFLGIGAVVAVVALLGIWLLSGGDGSGSGDTVSATGNGEPAGGTTRPDDPAEIAGTAEASAPRTAPPGQDVNGDPVDYDAANLVDGDPETAWRMIGDGTGTVLELSFADDVVITSVGLVNGYAKIDRNAAGGEVNWYLRNRRVDAVVWIFDDGTRITQQLETTPDLQSVDVSPISTRTVRLKLVEVSEPGATNGRNYTPVSEVSLIGG